MTTWEAVNKKIFDWHTIKTQINYWRKASSKVVFTNGCFDLLHYGHIYYLSQAADLGDYLIVGLNADASVQRLKGRHRPIKDEKNRLHILAALSFVDAVILFQEDTPYQLIQLIQPDILVKGGDWQAKDIIGSDIVLEKGGKVLSLPFIEGYSTTALEQKVIKSCK